MSVKSFKLEVTAASALACATQPVLFGPIYIGDLQSYSVHVQSTATISVVLAYKFSHNENREGEVNAVLDNFDNTSVTVTTSANLAFSPKYQLGYEYITILGSATAAVPAAAIKCIITGKRFS